MSEILSIEQLKELSTTIIDIPGFNNEGTIKVKVKKPRLMAMAAQGKIPNHLLQTVNTMMFGANKQKDKKPKVEDVTNLYELYCTVCLVEPSYDELKEIITDEQMEAIFNWGMGNVTQLDNFRNNTEDGTDNNIGKQAPKRPSEIMNIDNDYLAYIFDEAALLLEVEATDSEGRLNWSKIKWKDKKAESNKDLMEFIKENG